MKGLWRYFLCSVAAVVLNIVGIHAQMPPMFSNDPVYKVAEVMPSLINKESTPEKKRPGQPKVDRSSEQLWTSLGIDSLRKIHNCTGNLIVEFVVDTLGYMTLPVVIQDKTMCEGYAEKVVSAILTAPILWIPAQQKSKRIRMKMLMSF